MLASTNVFLSDSSADWKAGLEVLRSEYENGSAFAAGKLGWAYHLGRGVPADDSKALEYYEIAAKGGMTYWQFLLAHAYEQGYYGLPKDQERSRYWLEFRPKVHTYTYQCAVYSLYREGRSFPEDDALEQQFKDRCDQSSGS